MATVSSRSPVTVKTSGEENGDKFALPVHPYGTSFLGGDARVSPSASSGPVPDRGTSAMPEARAQAGRLISKVSFNNHSHWSELARVSGFKASSLARKLGLSRRQVERYIKRHFSCTPQKWLRELRMAEAGELVLVMHTVKEVAYALQFPQVSSFCRQFKEHYGMTCSEYVVVVASSPEKAAALVRGSGSYVWRGAERPAESRSLDMAASS